MSKWKLVPVEATDQMIDAALDAKIGGKVLSCAEIYCAMLDAAPVQQTDPLGYFTFNKEWNVWEQMSAKYKNASDATPLYLHPPSAELARLRAENERLNAAAKALDLDDIEWALNASARQFSDEFTPMRMKIVQRTLMRVRSLRAAMTTPTAPPAR